MLNKLSSQRILNSGLGIFLLSCGLLSVNSAQASMVAVLSPSSSGNTFIYDINFLNTTDIGSGQPSERIDGCGSSCTGAVGSNAAYATVYDLTGVTAANIVLNPAFAALFKLTTQTTGITPSGTLPTDGAAINFTVTYLGPQTTAPFSDAAVITVTAPTSVRVNGNYTGQDSNNVGLVAGTLASNIGMVAVPGASTPEPGPMLTMASGGMLLLAGMLRRRKK